MEVIIVGVLGTAMGCFVGFFFQRFKLYKIESDYQKLLHEQEQQFKDQLNTIQQNKAVLNNEMVYCSEQKEELKSKTQELQKEKDRFAIQNAHLTAANKTLQDKLETQKHEIEELQKRLTAEFENLAQRILKKNTEDFSSANQRNMQQVVLPLKEKLVAFEKRVEETYEKGLKDQNDLRSELKKLGELNMHIGEEAKNLTRALKGDVKKQGNWGEMILESILERSGLTEGNEYVREKVTENADGARIRPDVIVNLPEKKHVVIDSKVSLVAYERWVNAAEDDERAQAMKDHLISVRSHIKELSEKHYSSAAGLNSPDFVLLFIPIESSFGAAVEADGDLFGYAWEHKVVLVSPSTLFATLRTIASIWQQKNQTKNALEIAKQGGALYDKFVGFVSDLERVGANMETLRKSYDGAFNKLSTGNGNLIRKAEQLKELGAKVSKEISEKYLD